MATTFTDTRDNATAEAVRVAQDAAHHYMDESVAISRTYFAASNSAAQASMRTAFDLQNAMILASRTMLEASMQATRSWFDQAVDTIHKNQDATMKLVVAGVALGESTMPKGRP